MYMHHMMASSIIVLTTEGKLRQDHNELSNQVVIQEVSETKTKLLVHDRFVVECSVQESARQFF